MADDKDEKKLYEDIQRRLEMCYEKQKVPMAESKVPKAKLKVPMAKSKVPRAKGTKDFPIERWLSEFQIVMNSGTLNICGRRIKCKCSSTTSDCDCNDDDYYSANSSSCDLAGSCQMSLQLAFGEKHGFKPSKEKPKILRCFKFLENKSEGPNIGYDEEMAIFDVVPIKPREDEVNSLDFLAYVAGKAVKFPVTNYDVKDNSVNISFNYMEWEICPS